MALAIAALAPEAWAGASFKGWSAPVTLSSPATAAGYPSLGAGGGVFAAVWARQDGTAWSVQAAVKRPGSPWGPALTVSGTDHGAIRPSVAVGRHGDVTVVWTTAIAIRSSTLAVGGSWTAPRTVASGTGLFDLPRAVIGPNGRAIALWAHHGTNVSALESSSQRKTGAWTSPVLVSPAGGYVETFDVAADASGEIAAAWDTASFTSAGAIWTATRDAGGAWSAPEQLSPPSYRQAWPRIGIAANGDQVVTWRKYTVLLASERLAHGSWEPPTTLYSANDLSDRPALAVTPSGDAMAAWVTWVSGNDNYRIRTAIRPVGGIWQAQGALTSDAESDVRLVAASTAFGMMVLAWTDWNMSAVRVATRTITEPWADPRTLGTGTSEQAVAAASSKAVVLWIGFDGGQVAQASTAKFGS